jgi:FMN phosphatase YigB (HAD superfamily)
MKPHDGIYLEAERRFSLTPAETVFIDDRAENAAAAASLGIHAVQYVSAAQLTEALARFDVSLTEEIFD